MSGHRPHSIADVTFADGIPVAMGYREQHFYADSPKGWSMLEMSPTAGSFPPPFRSATWELESYSSSLFGTYSFGPPIPAVPEPETWALLLAGLAVIGAGSRRRHTDGAQVAAIG